MREKESLRHYVLITIDLMEDPVICEDGYTYERKAILEYLKH